MTEQENALRNAASRIRQLEAALRESLSCCASWATRKRLERILDDSGPGSYMAEIHAALKLRKQAGLKLGEVYDGRRS
jgi:hypothetical protein